MNAMQAKIDGIILGVKKFKGDVEGIHYDSCKVLVTTPLDNNSGNALGFSVSEFSFGESSNFERFKSLEFPFSADLSVEIITNGRTQKFRLIDFSAK